MLELDGSQGEGGGQILRTSLTLSLLTGKSFHLRRIRAGRKKPGLQPQHLMCVQAAMQIGQARAQGATLNSTDLVFEPGPTTPGNYTFSIGTAGATSLVLHTVYLPLALRGTEPSQLMIRGGTHVTASPCFHFLDSTWRGMLETMGVRIDLTMRGPGFYPRGGGLIDARVQPAAGITSIDWLDRGPLLGIHGISAVAGLPADIAARQARRASERLRSTNLPLEIETQTWDGGPGAMLALILNVAPAPICFFGLGARGKPAERVADEAADQLLGFLESTAAVDPQTADQLPLPLAFATGSSRYTVSEATNHLLTNLAVIRAFVDRDLRYEDGVVFIS